MLDNKETLTISSTLTKIGKKRLSEGNLKITKASFGDDGMNYKLINNNLSDNDILLRRTPLFDVWKDGHMGVRNKVMVGGRGKPNNMKLEYSSSQDKEIFVEIDGEDKKFPEEKIENGNRTFVFYGKNALDLSKKPYVELSFNHNSIFNTTDPKFITATLYDQTYFDISLSLNNASKYARRFDMREDFDFIRDDNDHNQLMRQLINGQSDLPEASVSMNMLDRNFASSFFINREDINSSKTINILSSQEQSINRNSFVLFYKGNFSYENADIENYETFIELLDENTGRTEFIKLSIIPTTN